MRPHICRDTALEFGLDPTSSCFADAPSLFVRGSFSTPICLADEPVILRRAHVDGMDSPDLILVADLQTNENCDEPADAVAVAVELLRDDVLTSPDALVGRLALDGSHFGPPVLLVMEMTGDALVPVEIPADTSEVEPNEAG